MKLLKRPKEKGEQTSIQGSISKSAINGKRSSKSAGVQHIKKAVGKDVSSTVGGVFPQLRGCNTDTGYNLEIIRQLPLDAKSEERTMLYSSPKIKLQLFPIDDILRKGLEMEGHYPYLELTLSARKKITSVLKHLCNKWGSSRFAKGELMLFPFNVEFDTLSSSIRWSSSEIGVTARDVHAALGNPTTFRLRYGWVSIQPSTSSLNGSKRVHVDNGYSRPVEGTSMEYETNKELEPCNKNMLTDMAVLQTVPSEPLNQVAHKNEAEVISEDLKQCCSSQTDNDTAAVEGKPVAEPTNYEEPNIALNWSDLSNISIGGLLSEVSMQAKFNAEDPRSGGSRLMSQPIATDSLDAFIAQYKYPQASNTAAPDMPSSILDAESTCHSFSFSKQQSLRKDLPTLQQSSFSGLSDQKSASEPFKCPQNEGNAPSDVLNSNSVQEPKTDSNPFSLAALNNENSIGLSSLKWNDSLGPFDLPLTPQQLLKDDSLSIGGIVR